MSLFKLQNFQFLACFFFIILFKDLDFYTLLQVNSCRVRFLTISFVLINHCFSFSSNFYHFSFIHLYTHTPCFLSSSPFLMASSLLLCEVCVYCMCFLSLCPANDSWWLVFSEAELRRRRAAGCSAAKPSSQERTLFEVSIGRLRGDHRQVFILSLALKHIRARTRTQIHPLSIPPPPRSPLPAH